MSRTASPAAASSVQTVEVIEIVEDRRRKGAAWKPLAAAGIGGAVLLATGFGVFAQLQATATNTTPQAIETGDLKLTLAADSNAAGAVSAGFSTAVSNLAPQDSVTRLVSVTNAGSLDGKDMTLAVADSVGSLLSTDATRGLQVSVQNCAVAWTTTPGTAAAPTCSAGATTALSTTPLAQLGSAKALTALTTAGSVNRFLVTVALPDQTETSVNGAAAVPAAGTGSIQKLNAQLTWTFSETQRNGININS